MTMILLLKNLKSKKLIPINARIGMILVKRPEIENLIIYTQVVQGYPKKSYRAIFLLRKFPILKKNYLK
ncbi:MAG: hypothetical protein CM15mP63_1700 [Gammaproteobacteria bacterium]|nr:MAG: hypothetical protein CM15mP63_1700 [Gammaproteobacteria bacterium]